MFKALSYSLLALWLSACASLDRNAPVRRLEPNSPYKTFRPNKVTEQMLLNNKLMEAIYYQKNEDVWVLGEKR